MSSCLCPICRYHVFHIIRWRREDGVKYQVLSHSQSDANTLANWVNNGKLTWDDVATYIPISEFQHGITQEELAVLFEKYKKREEADA